MITYMAKENIRRKGGAAHLGAGYALTFPKRQLKTRDPRNCVLPARSYHAV